MPPTRPRFGSLQIWPRKRAEKNLPSTNWKPIQNLKIEGDGLLGFIAYKAGMATAVVKDDTPNSMTKGKRIVVPVTILEAPNMKIFSVRFYKNGICIKDVIVSNDKVLKSIVKVPKELKSLDSQIPQGYDDIRVIAHSIPSQTGVKKTPDITELAIHAKDKLAYVKSLIGKEVSYKDFLSTKVTLLDVRGLTKGHGLSGTVKRFGIGYRSHKAEKGQKHPGSLGPWHPARVTYMVPQSGQLGMFSRVHYNQRLLSSGSISEKNINPASGFTHYGTIKSNYLILSGSVQGPAKRQILLTVSYRPSKAQSKKKLEFVEIDQ